MSHVTTPVIGSRATLTRTGLGSVSTEVTTLKLWRPAGTCTVWLLKPMETIWKVDRSRLSGNVCVTATSCAGAVAVDWFSKSIVYDRVWSGVIQCEAPKPAGPIMSFGSCEEVFSIDLIKSVFQGSKPASAHFNWCRLGWLPAFQDS